MNMLATINNSISQRKFIFRVPNTSINYRVIRSMCKKNYLDYATKDGRHLTVAHRLDHLGNPIIRRVHRFYGAGRKYPSVTHQIVKVMATHRDGNTLLLTSGGKDGLTWVSEASLARIGGILLLKVYF